MKHLLCFNNSNSRFLRIVICVGMLFAYTGNIWGYEWTWHNDGTDGAWSEESNWRYYKTILNTGWKSDNSASPGIDVDNDVDIYLRGSSSTTITLSENIDNTKIKNIYLNTLDNLGTPGSYTAGSEAITINFKNNATLKIANLIAGGSDNKTVSFKLTGGGKLIVTNSFDTPNTLGANINIEIDENTTLEIQNYFWLNIKENEYKINFTGKGNLIIPNCGGIVDGIPNVTYAETLNISAYTGETFYYYKLGTVDFSNINSTGGSINLNNKNASSTVYYPYTAKVSGAGTFSIGSKDISNGSFSSTDGIEVSKGENVSIELKLTNGDSTSGIYVTLYAPDGSGLKIGTFCYGMPVWTGASSTDSGKFTNPKNWSIAGTPCSKWSEIEGKDVIIPAGCSYYPGYIDTTTYPYSYLNFKSITIEDTAQCEVSTNTSSDFTISLNSLYCNGSGYFSVDSSATNCKIKFINENSIVQGNNTFQNVEFSGTGEINILGNNTFGTLIFSGEGSTVKFAAGKTQTVKTSMQSTGSSGKEITLTTNAASPSISDESTWWILDAPLTAFYNEYFYHTKIEFLRSVKDIIHSWDLSVTEGTPCSTINLFLSEFYWFGRTNSKWNEKTNWYVDENKTSQSPRYPVENSKIIICASKNPLILDNDFSESSSKQFYSFTVNAGAIFDIASYNLKIKEHFTNKGTVRMVGTNEQSITFELTGSNTGMINATDSTIEYYGATEKPVWDGDTSNSGVYDYANLSFSGTANVIDKIDFSGYKLNVSGTTTIDTPLDISLNNEDNEFFGAIKLKSAKNITLNSNNKITIEKISEDATKFTSLDVKCAADVIGSKNLITTGNQNFEKDVTFAVSAESETGNISANQNLTLIKKANSLKTENGNISISGTLILSDANDTELNSVSLKANEITIGDGTTSITAQKQVDFNVTSQNGATFNGTVGNSSKYLGDIKISGAGNAIFNSSVFAKSLLVEGETTLGKENNSSQTTITTTGLQHFKGLLTILSPVTISNGGTLYIDSGLNAQQTGATFSQTGAGLNQIKGDFKTNNAISFATNVFIGGNFSLNTGTTQTTIGTNSENANLFITTPTGSENISISSPITCNGNIVLFNGALSLNENLTATQDIILLNGEPSAIYNDKDGTNGTSGVSELFKYLNRDNSIIAQESLDSFPEKLPDETPINHSEYKSSLQIAAGVTLTAEQNFYDNGCNITGNDEWILKLKDNNNATDAFAELHNASISNCKVDCITSGGTSYLAAAENCTDNSGNTGSTEKCGVFFSRPTISATGTYTIYDNVVRVEFVDSLDSTKSIKIENSNNEISAAIANIKYSSTADGHTLIPFEGAYIDSECTQSTDGQGDISTFYLKAADNANWNTDATGIFSGDEQSTDWQGEHKTAIPFINIPKALTDLYQTLRDEHKNRIAHYYSETPTLESENSTFGATFTAVADKTSPVLIAVRTGQENHTPIRMNASTFQSEKQPYYDSHNFIEFQYSESINAGNAETSNLLLSYKTDFENGTITEYSDSSNQIMNVKATETFGKIENSSEGLTVLGLAKLESGKLTASNPLTHSLYRAFSLIAGNVPTFQTHRIRLSIAGYVDEERIINGNSYKHWAGYIDDSQTPSGKITRLSSSLITDKNKNSLAITGTTEHALPELFVNNVTDAETELYGNWDCSSPVFAEYKTKSSDKTGFEILATNNAGEIAVSKVEFHLFDNELPSERDFDWFTSVGWCNFNSNGTNLYKQNYSYAADIIGGARQFEGNELSNPRRTSGGIRYSSLYDKTSYFKYKVKNSSQTRDFDTKNITGSAKSYVFLSNSGDFNQTGYEDSLYFAIYLNDSDRSDFSLRTILDIQYDQNGNITDLAGNRLKSKDNLFSIERTPPSFNFSVGAIPKDNFTYDELYLLFNKALKTEDIVLIASDRTETHYTFSQGLAKSLRFVKFDSTLTTENSINANDLIVYDDLKIAETGSYVKFKNDDFTGVIAKLSRPITYEELKTLWIQAYVDDSWISVDPLTGVENSRVTCIQDSIGNYLEHLTAHAISDFAINVINPIYAYDNRQNAQNNYFSENIYSNSSWAVHDWNAEQKKYGTLTLGQDLFIQASVSEEFADNKDKAFAYFDNNPDSLSISKNYNANTPSEADWRIWFPSAVCKTGLTPDFTTPIFKPFSEQNNKIKSTTIISEQSEYDEKSQNQIHFDISKESIKTANYKSGDQISFLFSLVDKNDEVITICHAPDYNPLTNKYSLEQSPLFAMRLKNPGDLTSADLWSFKFEDITLQRGGVTILNNVINVSNGEKTVVQVDVKNEGTLNVIVMTLDGNIVQYLQHGTTSSGTHYYTWNGTTKSGKKVARGLYFIRVFGSEIDETRKVLVVK